MSHSTDRFAHDHGELNGLLLAVHAALSRVERDPRNLVDELHEIRDGVEAFREALLEHFAREQETLLPFVVLRLPAMRARCDALVVDHDRIAEMITDVVQDLAGAEASGTLTAWAATLNGVEATYASHTKLELSFFDEVEADLASDPAALEELRTLTNEPGAIHESTD